MSNAFDKNTNGDDIDRRAGISKAAGRSAPQRCQDVRRDTTN